MTAQELFFDRLGALAARYDLVVVTERNFSNEGRLHLMRGLDTVLSARYHFQAGFNSFESERPIFVADNKNPCLFIARQPGEFKTVLERFEVEIERSLTEVA